MSHSRLGSSLVLAALLGLAHAGCGSSNGSGTGGEGGQGGTGGRTMTSTDSGTATRSTTLTTGTSSTATGSGSGTGSRTTTGSGTATASRTATASTTASASGTGSNSDTGSATLSSTSTRTTNRDGGVDTGNRDAGSAGSGGSAGAGGTGGSAGKGGSGGTGGTAGKGGSGGSAGGTGGSAGSGGSGSGGSSGSGGAAGTGGSAGSAGTGGSATCAGPKAGTKSSNPLFTDVYTADPAPFVHNCTFYITCGHDEGGGNGFVMNEWFLLKSTDMVNWTKTTPLSLTTFNKWADANAWASQMVRGKDGKFYWYVPVNKRGTCPNNCGMAIGVAVADSPEGPFTDALGKPLIDDKIEMANWNLTLDSDSPYTIDPTVYVDTDGTAYMHYGSFGRVVHLKLGADMKSIDGKMQYIDLGRLNNPDGKNSFFEAAFLTKRNGKWYEIYAAGDNPAAINYSTADNPAGPWKAGGRVLDPLPTNSTDGATNHSGVIEFAGQWYIVYHISNGPNGGGTYHRMVAVDKLNFNADGSIQKVTPSKGIQF